METKQLYMIIALCMGIYTGIAASQMPVAQAKQTQAQSGNISFIFKKTVDSSLNKAMWDAIANDDYPSLSRLFLGNRIPDVNDGESWTPLMTAAQSGKEFIVEFLAEQGADLNVNNSFAGTALMRAVNNHFTRVVELLIKHGADLNIRHKNSQHDTALMRAIKKEDITITDMLIKAGALLNLPGEDDETALMYATEKGYTAIVKLLIGAGANVNARDVHGSTALMGASRLEKVDIVPLLIAAGADLNAQDNWDNKTALMVAARNGHAVIAHILVAAGADPDIRDKEGKTALDYANNVQTIADITFGEDYRPGIQKAIDEGKKERAHQVAQAVQEQTPLIPDLAGIVAEYV